MRVEQGTIAVTGASGFIGRYLCADLAAAGYGVLRLGRGAGMDQEIDRQTDYSRASLTDALAGAAAVIHLAGRRMTRADDPRALAPFWGPNVAVMGDLVAAAAATGVRKIILASTIAVYGPASGIPYREGAATHPPNAYGLSKLMAEAHLEMQARLSDIAALSLRLTAVYGQGEKGTPALMTFVNRARAGQPLVITGNPAHGIDELYIRDATAALRAALRSDLAAGVINIGSGRAVTIEEIAHTVAEVFGPVPVRLEPRESDPQQTGPQQTGPVPQPFLDIARAQALMGWRPTYDLRQGLMDFRKTAEAAEAG
jgi:nucleoside-diphosphate-sugar epimerase